jgi:hypothetical protein
VRRFQAVTIANRVISGGDINRNEFPDILWRFNRGA